MSITSNIMEITAAYRLWQAPFVKQKLEPILRRGDIARARRVLDIGCGPGTNTPFFAHADYLGVDIDAGYIADARERHKRSFEAADASTWRAPDGARFDFVIANSFFHHVDTDSTRRILAHAASLLTEDGHIHVLDLVLPGEAGIPRTLARWDRGEFPRPLAEWRTLFGEAFEEIVFEPYSLTLLGCRLWSMVYFKGRPR